MDHGVCTALQNKSRVTNGKKPEKIVYLLDWRVMLANGLCPIGSLGDVPHLEGIVTSTGKHRDTILTKETKRRKEEKEEYVIKEYHALCE